MCQFPPRVRARINTARFRSTGRDWVHALSWSCATARSGGVPECPRPGFAVDPVGGFLPGVPPVVAGLCEAGPVVAGPIVAGLCEAGQVVTRFTTPEDRPHRGRLQDRDRPHRGRLQQKTGLTEAGYRIKTGLTEASYSRMRHPEHRTEN